MNNVEIGHIEIAGFDVELVHIVWNGELFMYLHIIQRIDGADEHTGSITDGKGNQRNGSNHTDGGENREENRQFFSHSLSPPRNRTAEV